MLQGNWVLAKYTQKFQSAVLVNFCKILIGYVATKSAAQHNISLPYNIFGYDAKLET